MSVNAMLVELNSICCELFCKECINIVECYLCHEQDRVHERCKNDVSITKGYNAAMRPLKHGYFYDHKFQ